MKKYFYKITFSFLCTPIDIDFCVCVFLVVKLGGELDVELVRLARLVSISGFPTTNAVGSGECQICFEIISEIPAFSEENWPNKIFRQK